MLGTIRDRVVGFRRIRASDLEPHPQNWRRHPENQSTALLGLLADVGFAGAMLVRELPSGRFQTLDGHLRAETVPDMEVPCLVLDLDDREARKLLVTHDPLTAMAEQDARELAGLLADLERAGDLDVAKLVLPDYVVDPLLSADWLPSGKGSLGGENPPSAWHHTLVLNPAQQAVIEETVAKVRADVGEPGLSPGDCLVRVCEHYLGQDDAAA